MRRKEQTQYLKIHAVASYLITLSFGLVVLEGYFKGFIDYMDQIIFGIIGLEIILVVTLIILQFSRYKGVSHPPFLLIGWAITFHSIYEMFAIMDFFAALDSGVELFIPSLVVPGLLASGVYYLFSRFYQKKEAPFQDLVVKWKCMLPTIAVYLSWLSLAVSIWLGVIWISDAQFSTYYVSIYLFSVMSLFVGLITYQLIRFKQPRLWYLVIGLYSFYILVFIRLLSNIYFLRSNQFMQINNLIIVLYILVGVSLIGYGISFMKEDEARIKRTSPYDLLLIIHIIIFYSIGFARSGSNTFAFYFEGVHREFFTLYELFYQAILFVICIRVIIRLIAPFIQKHMV